MRENLKTRNNEDIKLYLTSFTSIKKDECQGIQFSSMIYRIRQKKSGLMSLYSARRNYTTLEKVRVSNLPMYLEVH